MRFGDAGKGGGIGTKLTTQIFDTETFFLGGRNKNRENFGLFFCEPFCAPPVFGDIPVFIGGCNC